MSEAVEVAELVDNLLLGQDDVTVLVVSATFGDAVLQELEEELAFGLEEEAGEVSSVEGVGPKGIPRILERPAGDVVLWTGLEAASDDDLRRLDTARNRLMGGPMLVIVTTEEGAAQLRRHAPNLWSWVGSRCFVVAEQDRGAQLERRLESLREATGLTDEAVITRAQAGELPPDPVFGEWLALLGRGDLVGV
ncbi:MAG: hypothetical protein H6739_21695 [Alphaproteobacteria bacterium]|nr:hypothetical protein [Alphaproteobacteria bacterium]